MLARRAATVGLWTLVSRVLGLLRDRLFAGGFGAGPGLDAFMFAFQLPNLLRNLFGEGALSTVFVPRYVQARQVDPAQGDRLAGRVITRLALGLSVFCAVAMAGAAAVAAWAPAAAAEVARLALPQLPYAIFICCAAVMAGILHARGRFAAAAAAPVVLNLCLIATVVAGPLAEIEILPYAVLVAGVLQVALLMLALARSGGLPPLATEGGSDLSELRRALVPGLLAAGLYQINALLDTVIAYVVLGSSAAGAVTVLYFANRLLQFPMALIGHAVATAAFADLAARAREGWAATGVALSQSLRLTAWALVPAAIGLGVVADPLVRTIYQTGLFDETAVVRTIWCTQFLALALVPIALAKLQIRAFHAHLDQRTPLLIGAVQVGLNLVLNLILVQTPLAEAGLCLATAISGLLGCALQAMVLRRRGAMTALGAGLLRPVLAGLAMGVAVGWLLWWWPQPEGGRSLAAAPRLAAAVGLGALVYLPLAGLGPLRRQAKTQDRP